MEQFGSNCLSPICGVCKGSKGDSDSIYTNSSGAKDFVECVKCHSSIHKICFQLTGDLLKIFTDYEDRHEEFPFTILCSKCRQFNTSMDKPKVATYVDDDGLGRFVTDKPLHKVLLLNSIGGGHDGTKYKNADFTRKTNENDLNHNGEDKKKNPFEIDLVVQEILEKLNIPDLINVRLVNTLFNQTVCRILSKESKQVKLLPYPIKGSNSTAFKKCLEFLKNSQQSKLFQQLDIYWTSPRGIWEGDEVLGFQVLNEIVTITRPTYVQFKYNKEEDFVSEDLFLLSNFLTNISETVVNLSLHITRDVDDDDCDLELFSNLEFSQLKTITIHYIANIKLVRMIISKSPKLVNLALYNTDGYYDHWSLDPHLKGEDCILSQESAQNLQTLKVHESGLNFETLCELQMKLKTLKICPDFIDHYPHEIKFSILRTFLQSQRETLENLKIYLDVNLFDEIDPEEVVQMDENILLDLPRLENLQYLRVALWWAKDFTLGRNIWPIKPIDLPEKLPNLKKISIKYCTNWNLSFETGNNCSTVTELVVEQWNDGNFSDLVALFPQVEFLKLKKFSNSHYPQKEKIYTELKNLNGWSACLRKIEINCRYYHLENFNFENLVCLTNLESIKITAQTHPSNSKYLIYPDFEPLFKIPTLSQVVIKNFKISKGIVEDLREKFPSLDYSFYAK